MLPPWEEIMEDVIDDVMPEDITMEDIIDDGMPDIMLDDYDERTSSPVSPGMDGNSSWRWLSVPPSLPPPVSIIVSLLLYS